MFNSSRNAEENPLVGMAKETAHQLGTPISTDAWVSMMQGEETTNRENMVCSLNYQRCESSAVDLDRFLRLVLSRTYRENIELLLEKMMNYLRLRSSERVVFYGNYAEIYPR